MAARVQRNNGSLAAAVTVLIQTQAQFVAELAESRREFAAMRQDIETIKAILVRHEATLDKLAEALRDKVGFKR